MGSSKAKSHQKSANKLTGGQGDATDLAQEAQARKRSAAINEAHEKERRDMHKVRPQLHPATCKQLMT